VRSEERQEQRHADDDKAKHDGWPASGEQEEIAQAARE